MSVRLCAGLDFVFHMFFLVKYCKSLEEGEADVLPATALDQHAESPITALEQPL
jgi:hypothetical protein